MAAVAVYVVRHGDAEARDTWSGTDTDRPLTGRGVREARVLVDRFDTGPLGARLRELRLSEARAEADLAPVEQHRALHRDPATVGRNMRLVHRDR